MEKFIIDTKDFNKRRVVWSEKSYRWHFKKRLELRTSKNKIIKVLKDPKLKGPGRGKKDLILMRPERESKRGNQLYWGVFVDYSGKPARIRTALLTEKTYDCTIVL